MIQRGTKWAFLQIKRLISQLQLQSFAFASNNAVVFEIISLTGELIRLPTENCMHLNPISTAFQPISFEIFLYIESNL